MSEFSEVIDIRFKTKAGFEEYVIGLTSLDYFYLIEDIYSFSITGKIRFSDSIGLMEFGPITGDEEFIFTFGNNELRDDTSREGDRKYREITMKILKFERVDSIKGNRITEQTVLEFILVDEFFYSLHKNNYSKSWSNRPIHEIVREISTNHIGLSDFHRFENTNETIDYFDTHFRTPSESIQWLMNRSSGGTTGVPGYLFYHHSDPNTDDLTKFSFTTLESLLQQKTFMLPGGRDEPYSFSASNASYYNKVIDFDISLVDFNSLRSISGGVLLGFDTKRKKFIRREYDYRDALNKFTILGEKTLFSDDITVEYTEENIETLSDERLLDNMWYGNWIREYCNQNLVSFIVPGNNKRYAGGMIRVVWPSFDNELNVLNKQMNGKYLVKTVVHYFDTQRKPVFTQKLVCIKNGYSESDNETLIDAVNVNL